MLLQACQNNFWSFGFSQNLSKTYHNLVYQSLEAVDSYTSIEHLVMIFWTRHRFITSDAVRCRYGVVSCNVVQVSRYQVTEKDRDIVWVLRTFKTKSRMKFYRIIPALANIVEQVFCRNYSNLHKIILFTSSMKFSNAWWILFNVRATLSRLLHSLTTSRTFPTSQCLRTNDFTQTKHSSRNIYNCIRNQI